MHKIEPLRKAITVIFKRQCAACVAMLAGLVLALSSTPSSAFIFQCDLLGDTQFNPPHLQTKNVITFDVDLYQTLPPGNVALSKLTVGAGNQIVFDVLLTPPDAVGMFPDYRPDIVIPGQFAEGTFGSLPVGQYAVTTSVRVFDAANGFSKPCADMTRTLIVYADDGLSPVIEYYYALLDHYFITQNTDEIAALDAGVHPGWVRTGQSFLAYRPEQGVGQPVQRWYGLPGAGLETHFFTMNVEDDVFLYTHPSTWEKESNDAFDLDFPSAGVPVQNTCVAGEVPVYRLWNQRTDSNHRYTTDPVIKAQMIARGWVAEGYGPDPVMMCAFTR